MSTENWSNNQEQQYGGRGFNRGGPRREGGNANGGGYQGNRSYNGGYGGQRTYGGQNGGGRQYGQYSSNYGNQERQPRQHFNNGGGQPRVGGGFRFPQGGASSIMEIDTNKVGMVIGRRGGQIRQIQSQFNVHVKIGK